MRPVAKRETLYTEMKKVDGEEEVVGYHVCPSVKALAMEANGTAGGVVGPRADAPAPSEPMCLHQVEFERHPSAPPVPRQVVEFGVGARPGYTGRPGDVVAMFKIKAKYLRWGSGTEGGWCALPNAPIVWVGVL